VADARALHRFFALIAILEHATSLKRALPCARAADVPAILGPTPAHVRLSLSDRNPLRRISDSGPPRCALRPRKAEIHLSSKPCQEGSARARARALNPVFRPPLYSAQAGAILRKRRQGRETGTGKHAASWLDSFFGLAPRSRRKDRHRPICP